MPGWVKYLADIVYFYIVGCITGGWALSLWRDNQVIKLRRASHAALLAVREVELLNRMKALEQALDRRRKAKWN